MVKMQRVAFNRNGWFLLIVAVGGAGAVGVFLASRPRHAGETPHEDVKLQREQKRPPAGEKPPVAVKPANLAPVAPPPEPAAAPSEAAEPPSRAESTAEAEERAMRKEQLEVAHRLLKTIPNNADAVFLMGLVYKEQGDLVEAVKWWERSLELDPNHADAYDGIGHAFLLKGEYRNAAALFRKAIQVSPTMSAVHFRLAQALMNVGETRDAISALQKDIQISPKASRSHRLLGEAYLQLREYQQAKQHYETAIEIQPDYAQAHYGLAAVYARTGDKDKAGECRKRFKELEAENQKAGRSWRSVLDPLAITRRNVASTHTEVGRLYRWRGFLWRAERLWQTAATLDPKNAPCRFELAAFYESQNQLEKALKMYEQLSEIEPQNGLNHFYIGGLNVRLKRFDTAEAAFRKVIELVPERCEGYRALAQLYVQTDRNLPEAETLARKAMELEPIALNYFVLSTVCEKNGDRAGALSAIQQAVQLEPGNTRYQRVYERIKNQN